MRVLWIVWSRIGALGTHARYRAAVARAQDRGQSLAKHRSVASIVPHSQSPIAGRVTPLIARKTASGTSYHGDRAQSRAAREPDHEYVH